MTRLRATPERRQAAVRGWRACGLAACGLAACVLASSCVPGAAAPAAAADLSTLRQRAAESGDAELLSRWHLAELIAPGGSVDGARRARRALDRAGADHYLSHLSRALDDAWHGRPEAAAFEFVEAAYAARARPSVEARLVAWLAASRATALAARTPELWPRSRERVESLIARPGGIGWRARAHLVQWWLDEAGLGAARPSASVEKLGCVSGVRLAGPFGGGSLAHLRRSFPAEAPGPWPASWQRDGSLARVVDTREVGCEVEAAAAPPGVYYAESFLELERGEDVLLAVQGALAVWVDDRLVLDRDPAIWGVWPRFGVAARLSRGRHRVLAKLSEPRTLLRAMRLDGTPLGVEAGGRPGRAYALEAPEVLDDPNDLMRFVGPAGALGPLDPLTRYLVAALARLEGEADVASVVLSPLAEPRELATGPTLQTLAALAPGDPLVPRTELSDHVRELHRLAAERDPGLWYSRLALVLQAAKSEGLHRTVTRLERLAKRFDRVVEIQAARANALGQLGWQAEYRRVARQMAASFAGDPSALQAALSVADQTGDRQTARRLVDALRELDPTDRTGLERALQRRNRGAAARELERLERLDPRDHDELEQVRLQLRLRSGDRSAVAPLLRAALEAESDSGEARLAVADEALSRGDGEALHRSLAEAIQAGAETEPLERAIDAVEARTDFAPFRLDGLRVIREYEAGGQHQSATAARVLDYAAVWVHSDGSSRMLEHEIVRIQSTEAIAKFAEHPKLPGRVLNMRVIKQDGRTLEPEWVSGKPTVTFPHLEVGDYVETEQVQSFASEQRGERYSGMRWFFREENVAYARSEFVLIAPAHRPLDIEITGSVPEPRVERDGLFVTRRWRVDQSPAAPVEPLSAPIVEFLPSVRIGWGNGLKPRLERLAEQVVDATPLDPRIVQLAREIVRPVPGEPALVLSRRAYRWVQDNVKDGGETDPRRVLVGRQGNRWLALRALLRALGVPVRYLVVRNRLAAPAVGPISEADAFSVPLLRVGEGREVAWLTMQERHAPFGYVPVEARGMPAYELTLGALHPLQVPESGDQDRLEYDGTVALLPDGSANLLLQQRFVGKYAVRMRAGLEQVPEGRLKEVLETRVLGQALPGARLIDFELVGQDDLESPLAVHMNVSVGQFAERRSDGFVIALPLMPKLSLLATLPRRQTPLLIREAMHQRVRFWLQIDPGLVVMGLQNGTVEQGAHRVVARDAREPGRVLIDREASIAAGRVSPADYESFARFTRDAERLLSQPLVLRFAAPGDAPP